MQKEQKKKVELVKKNFFYQSVMSILNIALKRLLTVCNGFSVMSM